MKLIINDKTEEFKNSGSVVKDVLIAIQRALEQENLELSHLVVDGVPIYQDYEQYLGDQVEAITEIVVVTLNLKPLIEETLGSALEYVVNAVGLLKPLAESFYQSPGKDDWNRLADLFEGIAWLLDTMNRIDQIDQLDLYLINYDIWNEYVQTMRKLDAQIPEIEQAMINKDQVLIGDLILYEVLPAFEGAEEKLRFLVPSGGNHVS